MTNAIKEQLLKDAKLRLRLHTSAFDSEITDLLEACEKDLIDRNAISQAQLEEETVDPLIKRAMMTYCRAYFGTPEDPELLKKDYDEQKATLMMTTGYTNWEEANGPQ